MLSSPQAPRTTQVIHPAPAAALRSRGFTLIELLVVVLIIGIVLSFVTLSISVNSKAERLDRAAHRLLALTRTAATDAVLYGVELGLNITPKGYRFVRLTSDGWTVVADEHSLRPRELDADLNLVRIVLDGSKRTPLVPPEQAHGDDADAGDSAHATARDTTDDDDGDSKSTRRRPQALFLSSGELLPFVLELSARGVQQRYQLRGRANGKIELNQIQAGP